MNRHLTCRLPVALFTALVTITIGAASAQSFSDSTGGSSQARGELALTPSGIVPAPTHASPRSHADVASAGRFQPYADSTGGSSAARAERDLSPAHAARFAAATIAPIVDAH